MKPFISLWSKQLKKRYEKTRNDSNYDCRRKAIMERNDGMY